MCSRPSTFTFTRAKNRSDRDHIRATRMAAFPVESNSDATTLTEPHAMVESTISGSTISRLQISANGISSFYEVAPRLSHQEQRSGDHHQVVGVGLGAHSFHRVLNARLDA